MKNSIAFGFAPLMLAAAIATGACSEGQASHGNGGPAPETPAASAKSAAGTPASSETRAAEGARPRTASGERRSLPAAKDNGTTRKAPPAPSAPTYREVTIPAGTVLPVQLRTAVGSATSQVEDPVRGTLRRAVTIDGLEVVPAGSTVTGVVTEATRSGRVKGLARVAFRFSSLTRSGDAERLAIRTHVVAREAENTKKRDAATIGGGAAAGAVIGGIIGGGDGAAKGAAIGGGAGTGVVLSTRGKEVTLPEGTAVAVRLAEPVTVLVPVR